MSELLIFSLILLLAVSSQLLRVISLRILLQPYVRLNQRTGLAANLIGFLSNTILPFRLGDFVKALFLARTYRASVSITLPAVFIEKLIDLSVFTGMIATYGITRKMPIYLLIGSVATPVFILLMLLLAVIFFAKIHPVYPGKYWSIRLALYSVNRYLRQLKTKQLVKATLYILISWLLIVFCFEIGNSLFIGLWNSWIDHNISLTGFGWRFTDNQNKNLIVWSLFFFSLSIPLVSLWIYSAISPKANTRHRLNKESSPVGSILSDSWTNWFRIGFPLSSQGLISDLATKNNLKIVRLLNGGSGAQVCLTEDQNSIRKVLKISEGHSASRLLEQGNFMIQHKEFYNFPHTKILDSNINNSSLLIDYLSECISIEEYMNISEQDEDCEEFAFLAIYEMFINAHGTKKAITIEQSYQLIHDFYFNKIRKTVQECIRFAPELPTENHLRINGKNYSGIYLILDFIEKHILELGPNDLVEIIHGDATFSNIFINWNEKAIYSIDPNPSQPYQTAAIDFAKLLQSSVGNYEHLFEKSSLVSLSSSEVAFTEEYSLRAIRFSKFLQNRLSDNPSFKKEVTFHLFAHFVRLMPYRISNDRSRAAIFWARMIQVGNELFE